MRFRKDSSTGFERTIQPRSGVEKSRVIIIVFLVICVYAAGLVVAAPIQFAAASDDIVLETIQTDWKINDSPTLEGDWKAGEGTDYGYGPGKYYLGGNYAYALEGLGRTPSTATVARWEMGHRVGRQQIAVFVPKLDRHATAQVRYNITVRRSSGSHLVHSPWVNQHSSPGWRDLGEYDTNGTVTVSVTYHGSRPGVRVPSHLNQRSVGVDALAMRCKSDCSTGSITVPRSSSAPRNLQLRVDVASTGRRTIVATWDLPSSDGGSAITGYKYNWSRPGKTFKTHTTSGRRVTFNGALSNTTYTIKVQAVNAAGTSQTSTSSIKTDDRRMRPVYIDDEPRLEGTKSGNCALGGTKSCWKEVKIGNFSNNGYFERRDDKKFELAPKSNADDFWGTTGYHVVSIEAEKKQRVRWSFEDIEEGQYDAEIYLPDNMGDDSRQPGAIVRYRIYVDPPGADNRRLITERVDQSQLHDRGGKWISLSQIDIAERSDVDIYVSSYWPGGDKSDAYAARPSGNAGWQYHLAADAARLIPSDGQPDWSSLGAPYDSAKAWCVADVTVQILLQPLVNILKGMAVDAAITAALTAGGSALTAATGGGAAPVAAVVIASRIGLTVKHALVAGRIVDGIIQVLKVIKRLTQVKALADSVDTLDTLIRNIGTLVLDLPGKDQPVESIADLCENEEVWENYYGSGNVLDSVKNQSLKLLDWLVAKFQ